RRQPHPHTLQALADGLELAAEERDALLASGGESGGPVRVEAPSPAPRGLHLPVSLTPLIGRAAEVEHVCSLLKPSESKYRLLVLLGPGGVGKTRLALAAAGDLAETYADGVAFVDLAPLRDAQLVPAAIARGLEISEGSGRSARELLLDHLARRQVLLLLDNFEHLPTAAPLLAELLAACPRPSLLVSSRTALRLRGEHRFAVTPLPTPDDPTASLATIAASPAVRLFVDRAREVAQGFALDTNTAGAVAGICRRLDGLPLAIEP